MRRAVAICLLAVGLVLAPLAAAAAPGLAGVGDAARDATGGAQDDAGDEYAPGERVAGAIATEQSEFEGEVSERSFGAALAAAADNESAADVVAARLDRVETRLDDLDARNASLAERHENGSISRGTYAARVASIEAERASLERQLNASRTAADGLPADLLADRDVDAAAIDRLRTRASELGGPAVGELARSIAGPGVGSGVGPADRAPGEIPGLDDGLPGDRGSGGDGPGVGNAPGDGDGSAADDTNATDADEGSEENSADDGAGGDADTADGGGADADSTDDAAGSGADTEG